MIPEGWKIINIEDSQINIIDGDRGKNYPKQEEFTPEGFCLFLNASNVTKSGFNFDSCQFVSEERDQLLRKGRLERNDLVLTTRGTVGNVAFFDSSIPLEVLRINSGMVLLRNRDPHIDNRFIYLVLRSDLFQSQMKRIAFGSAQPQLTVGTIKKLRIPLPPLPEQRAIAAILGTWDRAIALTERRLAAAEQRKQALMQQLLTGRVRFPEFVKSTEKQATKYGDLPVDWKYVPLRQIAREMKSRNEGGYNYPVLSCTKHYGLVDSMEYFGRQIYSDDLSTYKVVRERQFAYATNHIEEGSIGYQGLHEVALISPMYTVFETNDSIDDSFLYKVLKTEKYRHIFEVNTNGTVNRRGSLRWDEFSQIHIPLPSLAEQRRIAAVLNTCDREIDLLRRKRDALQRQKQGLMQRLLTGRVRASSGIRE